MELNTMRVQIAVSNLVRWKLGARLFPIGIQSNQYYLPAVVPQQFVVYQPHHVNRCFTCQAAKLKSCCLQKHLSSVVFGG